MRPSEILAMKRDEVLALIEASRFANPRVFGSVARGEDAEGSDIDLLVEARQADASLFDLVHLEMKLADLLGVHVDIFTPGSLRSDIHARALHDEKAL